MNKMQLSDILEYYLDQVLTDQDVIGSALGRCSDYADKLRAELDAARWLKDQRRLVEMCPGHLGISRQLLVAQIGQSALAK